jgi:hypothetical protein
MPAQAVVFPAIEQLRAGALPEALGSETEASCFFHPNSRAATPCDECGRFLCSLCDLEIDGRHLCSACLMPGPGGRRVALLEPRRTMYDTVVLLVSTLPILFWPFLALSAPTTLYLVFRYWRTPGSLVPRTKVRFILAALFALAEIAGVGWLIWIFVVGLRGRL